MTIRLCISLLLPVLALAVQWILWPWLNPLVWFLFFPAVFFSARLGGRWGGFASTLLSIAIVWYFFIPPRLSWNVDNPDAYYSMALFLFMGYLISDTQERLRRAQSNIETALAEAQAANEKIRQLYQKTLELDELKTQFFANVSHELRTPLTLIMGPLGRRLAAPDLSEADRREGEMMLRNARLLYHHVSDLLDAAKLDAGHMTPTFARVGLGGLTRAIASQFDSLARERRIDYRIDVSADPQGEMDGQLVQRILLNLLSNAFKFTPEGGRIEVNLREDAGSAFITVQDSGPGVPANFCDAVFERFRQVDGGPRSGFGGTGLGLAIVKEFAELHGGSAMVGDAPGGGARFIVRLPLRAPAGTNLQSAAKPLDPNIEIGAFDYLRPASRNFTDQVAAPADADAPLVLVIEDNADMSAFIADSLRPHYRFACAFDGHDGLDQALALQPDLILCDVMMPEMSGEQLVEELRRHPATADVPIIMLTAKADDNLRIRLLKTGVQDYLIKPFVVEELLARTAGVIDERQRAGAALRLSEMSYRSLFENMINGYAHCRMIYENDEPRDFIYLDVNKTFERLTGLNGVTGRRVSEVIPGIREADPYLFEIYSRVALGGPHERFETYVAALRMWFSISVYSPQREHFVAIFDVITERKMAEESLRRQTEELAERNAELERFNRATVDREMDLIALKQQVNALSGQLGREPPYALSFLAHSDQPATDAKP